MPFLEEDVGAYAMFDISDFTMKGFQSPSYITHGSNLRAFKTFSVNPIGAYNAVFIQPFLFFYFFEMMKRSSPLRLMDISPVK